IAAITGLGEFSMVACTSGRLAPFMAPPNSVMSAPAMKVRPSQISTIALASDAIAALNPSDSPSRTLAESAFTGGEFRVTMATSPSWVRVVTELISVILGSLGIFGAAALSDRRGRKIQTLVTEPAGPFQVKCARGFPWARAALAASNLRGGGHDARH